MKLCLSRSLRFIALCAFVTPTVHGDIPGVDFKLVVLPANVVPITITAGPDGKIWFINKKGSAANVQAIGYFDVSGAATLFDITSTTQPSLSLRALTAGPDGNLWVTYARGTSSLTNESGVVRVTTTGTATFFSVPNRAVPDAAAAITTGPDGNLWAVERTNPNVLRIDTQGNGTVFRLSFPFGSGAIGAGPDGNIWAGMGNNIVKVTPQGTATAYPISGVAQGITAGPDGNVWFTTGSGSTGYVARITPSGQIKLFQIPTQFPDARGIAAGPDGNIWFTERGAAKIGRLILSSVPPSLADEPEIEEEPLPGTSDKPTDVAFANGKLVVNASDQSNSVSTVYAADAGKPDLLVTKDLYPVAFPRFTPGFDSFGWRIQVKNIGSAPAGKWTLTDTLPPEFIIESSFFIRCSLVAKTLTCTQPALAVGEVFTTYVLGRVPLQQGLKVTNRAVVNTDGDANDFNNFTDDVVYVVGDPMLKVSKTHSVNRETGKTEFRIEVTNVGPVPTKGDHVTIYDFVDLYFGALSASASEGTCKGNRGLVECTTGPIAPGQSKVVTITLLAPHANSDRNENYAYAKDGEHLWTSPADFISIRDGQTVIPENPQTTNGRHQ